MMSFLLLLLSGGCGASQPAPAYNWPVQSGPGIWSRKTNVWGVGLFATSGWSTAKLNHATSVMAQFLDNDQDGCPDDIKVLSAMVERQARMTMTDTDYQLETANPPDNIAGQSLYAWETRPDCTGTASTMDCRDAAIEEIFHLVSANGLAFAYPCEFSEQAGSKLTKSMDVARGGYFETVPSSYPSSAIYSYDDQTCSYECQATEYIYWTVATILGHTEGNCEMHKQEYRPCDKASVQTKDPLAFKLATDNDSDMVVMSYKGVIPDGQYTAAGGPKTLSQCGLVLETNDQSGGMNAETYCEQSGLTKEQCDQSSCCSHDAGQCWSNIGTQTCYDMGENTKNPCDKDDTDPTSTCDDLKQNGDETGVDSGGSCAPSCVDDPAFVWAGKYTCSDYSGTAFKFCTLEQADEGCPLTCKKCTTLDDPCEDSSTWEDKFGTPCSGYALDAVNSKHAQCGSDPKAAFHCPRSCGKCTFSKDCVLGPALETSDCTSNCGTVTQSVGEPAVGSGQCNPSTYSCQAGDGQCPGGEYADEANNCGDPSQGLSPVDCTINNDYGSYCVYGNHCACGEGFECETPGGIVDNECAPGSTCITPKDCEDDPNFLGKGEYTCSSYSGENSYKYCTPEGADEACPNTCKKCTTLDDPCEDSSTWKDSAGTKCDGYAVNAASSKHSQCTSAGAVYPCPRACGKCTSSCATHTCTAGTKKDNPGQIIVISSSDELCCNPPVEPEPEPEPEEGGFDFGTGCPGGSGEFIFNLPIKRTYLDVPGVIPEGKYGVDIRLEATADLDVTLVDIAYKGEQNQYLDGYNIVAFGDNSHAGLLNGANTETKVYSRPGIEPMSVTYSGYNGVAVNGVQNLGNEFIKVNSVTSAELKMRGFAYQTGEAKILYSWSRSQTKCCLGEELCVGDQFQKLIKEKDVITVGEIPAGKIDVHIVLDSDKDVDVQLFDKSTQTKIIGFWTEATGEGLLHGADQESAVYEGLTYTYSGYNGVMDNGQQKLGKEFIKITGTTNRAVIMKAYGYKEGNALIDYTYLEPRPVRSTSRGRAGPTSSHASRSANQQRRAGQREPRSQPQSRPRLRPRP